MMAQLAVVKLAILALCPFSRACMQECRTCCILQFDWLKMALTITSQIVRKIKLLGFV